MELNKNVQTYQKVSKLVQQKSILRFFLFLDFTRFLFKNRLIVFSFVKIQKFKKDENRFFSFVKIQKQIFVGQVWTFFFKLQFMVVKFLFNFVLFSSLALIAV